MQGDTLDRIGSMRLNAPLRGSVAFWALAGLALLFSHDAVFVVQLGPGERLTATLRTVGHEYWGGASLLLSGAGILAAAAAAARLAALRRRAANLGVSVQRGRSRAPGLLSIWARLAGVVVVGFAIQENVEHYVAHGHLLGPGALIGPEHPLALPVLAIVSFVAAIGAALFTATELALVAGIRAASARRRPEDATLRAPQRVPVPAGSILARFLAGRAPPRRFSSMVEPEAMA